MGFFTSKEKQARRDNKLLIAKLDGMAVRYVTVRDPESGEERVIGKSGRINTKNHTVVIVCNGTEAFRCPADEAELGELMSLNGVVIRHTEPVEGVQTIVVAYYQYYRKV